jgi:hypothetical protein
MGKQDRGQRKFGKQSQTKKFLVVAEGAVTEREYIEAVKRSRRMRSVEVLIETGHTDPIGIVKQAKARHNEASKTDPFDQVWCIFDVEAKLTQQARFGLQEALDAARRSKIRCAVSNPCFEIWLLWHSVDHANWIASDAVQRRCKELGITQVEDEKHIQDANGLVRNYCQTARDRASNVEQMHERDGKTNREDRNPSSLMYQLIDAIYAAFPPRG